MKNNIVRMDILLYFTLHTWVNLLLLDHNQKQKEAASYFSTTEITLQRKNCTSPYEIRQV